MTETITDFIEFPPRDIMLSKLREVDDSSPELDDLYGIIADRLEARTYERSAAAFILIELVYDFEESHDGEWSYVLPRAIMSLTGDRDLALTALSAFNEIKDAIGPSEVQTPEPIPEPSETEDAPFDGPSEPTPEEGPSETDLGTAELQTRALFEDEEPADGDRPAAELPTAPVPSESDLLMAQLQNAQKALSDMGLGTRVSIDLAMRRSTRDRVSRTLQDISALRTALRRFEELLSRAELQVLESAGLLWGDEED